MRDPYEILGVSKGASAAEIKSAFRSSPRNCIPTPTSTIRKRPRVLPSSTRPTKLSATTTSARRSTAARSTPRASRASRASPARNPARGGFGRRGRLRKFHLGPDGFQRRGAGVAAGGSAAAAVAVASRILLRGMFGGRAQPGGSAASNSSRKISARSGAGGRDLHAELTITLADAAKRRQDARPSADRQGRRSQNSGGPRQRPDRSASRGRAGPSPRGGAGDALITVHDRAASDVHAGRRRSAARPAGHALRGGARRQGAGADARRRGRTGDPGRHQCGPHLPPQGQGPQGEGRRPAICSPPCASCCRTAATTSSRS